MRVGWPPILFLSAVVHIGGLFVFLLAGSPHSYRPASETAEAPAVNLLLRSEASFGQPVVVASARLAQPVAKENGVPVLPSPTPQAVTGPAAVQPVNALALKDRNGAQVRLPSSFGSPTATQINSHNGVVFVLDISGSMYEPYAGATRLLLARQLLDQRIRDLKEETPFAVVVYGETARRNGPLVPANDATRGAAIHFIGQEYECGGGTNLPVGLALAQELHPGAILLISDGDFNMAAPELLPKANALLGPIGHGPSLAVLGIGPRANTDADRLLHALAEQQDGTYQSAQGGSLTADLTPKSVATP